MIRSLLPRLPVHGVLRPPQPSAALTASSPPTFKETKDWPLFLAQSRLLVKRQGRDAVEPILHAAVLSSITWVPIPAGSFLYGSGNRSIYLGDFAISHTPIVIPQFAAFVLATGHLAAPCYHRPIDRSHRGYPADEISYDDAVNFCRWLGVRLPTGCEWEKAARGEDGRLYPWGNRPPDDTRANYRSPRPTPVDAYPDGASPYGVLDMAGNGWEYTSDPYPGGGHVMRSGAFYNFGVDLRCVACDASEDDCRYPGHGFRVVRLASCQT